MNAQDEINRLDLAYQKMTGHHFRASGVITGREQAWATFLRAGYTVHDLEETILWIKRGILAKKRFEGALKFRTLISNLDTWEDECATAKAEKRNAKPQSSPRDRAVGMLRPKAVESTAGAVTARPVSAVDWRRGIDELRRAVG